jgi:hypothetical protein
MSTQNHAAISSQAALAHHQFQMLAAVVAALLPIRRRLSGEVARCREWGEGDDDTSYLTVAEVKQFAEDISQCIAVLCHAIDPGRHSTSVMEDIPDNDDARTEPVP